nr:hypothetical protein [uncultured Pseudomonas sp.]
MQFEKISLWLRKNWKLLMLTPMAIVLGLLLLIWMMGLDWGSQNAPAWVQAVGSIAAILAAILIANGQSRREQARIRSREEVWFKVIVCDVQGARKHLSTLLGLLSQPGTIDWERAAEIHVTSLQALERLDLMQARRSVTVELISDLKSAMRDMEHFLTTIKRSKDWSVGVTMLQARCAKALESADAACQHLSEAG